MLIKSASAVDVSARILKQSEQQIKKTKGACQLFSPRQPADSLSLDHEDKEKGYDKGVDPCGFGNGLTNKHGPGEETCLIGVSAYGFTGFSSDKTLTDTWSNGTKSHSHACTQQSRGADQFSSGDIHSNSSLNWLYHYSDFSLRRMCLLPFCVLPTLSPI
jgi:hypothetical protein